MSARREDQLLSYQGCFRCLTSYLPRGRPPELFNPRCFCRWRTAYVVGANQDSLTLCSGTHGIAPRLHGRARKKTIIINPSRSDWRIILLQRQDNSYTWGPVRPDPGDRIWPYRKAVGKPVNPCSGGGSSAADYGLRSSCYHHLLSSICHSFSPFAVIRGFYTE